MKHTVRLSVNRREYEEEAESRQLLVHFIRETLGLTGTHIGCVIGECGACSVLVDGLVVKSCLMLAAQADGCDITTIEGLEQDGVIHPLQDAFVEAYGVQCGFCTPGMILTALVLLRETPTPDAGHVKAHMNGTLCRCTGYWKIIDAVVDAGRRLRASGAGR